MKKTSVQFDDDTAQILDRRAAETGKGPSAYLADLIRRDDRRKRIAADSVALNQAGITPERATTVSAALIAARRAAS